MEIKMFKPKVTGNDYDIAKQPFDLLCPHCKRLQRTTLTQIELRTVRCACGVIFSPDSALTGEVRKAKRSLSDFQRKLEKLFR